MAEIVASDIRVFNGNFEWISIKNNVKIYNGASFIDAKSIRIANGAGDFYKVSAGTFVVNTTLITFHNGDFPSIISFTATPDDTVNLVSKPSWVTVNINNTTNTLEIGYSSFLSGRSGSVVLNCSNGAPDVSITVSQVS